MTDWRYVDTQPALMATVRAVAEAATVGFDTEFVGEATYEPVLCLMQVATPGGIWVVDPLRPGLDLAPFWEALTAPERTLVAVAARQEVLFCLHFAGRAPGRVFDPQVAAGLLGYGYPLSLSNLLHKVLGVRVRGGETVTDWRKRPLTPKQLEYAAEDVRWLLPVYERLTHEAEVQGRTAWVEGECVRLVERVQRGLTEERWQRMPGAAALPRRTLAVLRELWLWRDAEARRNDQPPRRVLADELLVEVAKRSPTTLDDLYALRGMDRYRRAGRDLLAAVQRGMAVPEDQLPESLRRHDPPQLSLLSGVLSVVANSLAAEHRVDPALLATSSDLQDLVRWHLGMDGDLRPAILDGWRGDILGRPLEDLLAGKSAIRIRDVRSRNPIAVEPR